MSSRSKASVRTRFLILADTHGYRYLPDTKPVHPVDVVIHCGDLTADSRLAEYDAALQLLRDIDAPLKLVIPGNHDFSLDPPTYERIRAAHARCHHRRRLLLNHHHHHHHHSHSSSSSSSWSCSCSFSSDATLQQRHGTPAAVRRLFDSDAARAAGVVYLDEGTHRLRLANGARLAVYASPYTPAFGSPAFQYAGGGGRDLFAIPPRTSDGDGDGGVGVGVDVVVTHGPPRGIRDRSSVSRGHAGSPELWAAVARARPRLHCFGHIHEGWGAEVVAWRSPLAAGTSTAATGAGAAVAGAVDETGYSPPTTTTTTTTLLADLGSIPPLRGDPAERVRDKERRLAGYARGGGRCVRTSHCAGDALPIVPGDNTLFVNAAVLGAPMRPAWVVDLELPPAEEEGESLQEEWE